MPEKPRHQEDPVGQRVCQAATCHGAQSGAPLCRAGQLLLWGAMTSSCALLQPPSEFFLVFAPSNPTLFFFNPADHHLIHYILCYLFCLNSLFMSP